MHNDPARLLTLCKEERFVHVGHFALVGVAIRSESKILMDWKKSSKIKSLTLRLRSDDDRLRIYWQDGKVSDFPCTKEQRTWACG